MPSVRWPASAGHVVHAVFPRAYRPSPFPAEVLLRTRLARRLSVQTVISLPVAKQTIISAPNVLRRTTRTKASRSTRAMAVSLIDMLKLTIAMISISDLRPVMIVKAEAGRSLLSADQHTAPAALLQTQGRSSVAFAALAGICAWVGEQSSALARPWIGAYHIRCSLLVLRS